jgi:hypothetical protein
MRFLSSRLPLPDAFELDLPIDITVSLQITPQNGARFIVEGTDEYSKRWVEKTPSFLSVLKTLRDRLDGKPCAHDPEPSLVLARPNADERADPDVETPSSVAFYLSSLTVNVHPTEKR